MKQNLTQNQITRFGMSVSEGGDVRHVSFDLMRQLIKYLVGVDGLKLKLRP